MVSTEARERLQRQLRGLADNVESTWIITRGIRGPLTTTYRRVGREEEFHVTPEALEDVIGQSGVALATRIKIDWVRPAGFQSRVVVCDPPVIIGRRGVYTQPSDVRGRNPFTLAPCLLFQPDQVFGSNNAKPQRRFR